MTSTTSEKFFDSKYQNSNDPWSFSTSNYERGRYQRILRALGEKHFRLAYEPGCSVGVLTEQLAARSEVVEACDISVTAVEIARQRCRNLSNVTIRHASLTEFMPYGADLYVFCEIGYYFERDELMKLMAAHVCALSENATVVACHWLGSSSDHLLLGDEVHEILKSMPGLVHEYSESHPEFLLDRWRKQEASQ